MYGSPLASVQLANSIIGQSLSFLSEPTWTVAGELSISQRTDSEKAPLGSISCLSYGSLLADVIMSGHV